MMSRPGTYRRGPLSKYVIGVQVGPYTVSGYVGGKETAGFRIIRCEHGKEFTWRTVWMCQLKKVKVCRCRHPTCKKRQTLQQESTGTTG